MLWWGEEEKLQPILVILISGFIFSILSPLKSYIIYDLRRVV
jgi:hypothetical protein